MKQYDHIDYYGKRLMGEVVYAFDKLDGSNLRFEWSKKRGWYKFGTRKMMIDHNHPDFGASIPIFLNKYGDELDLIFRKNKNYRNVQNIIVFCEWYGPNSFAGHHFDTLDKMNLVLFDVNPMTKGFVGPKEFIQDFGHLDTSKLIYHGNLNMDFINSVKRNDFNLMEGVVCKAKDPGKTHQVWMVKVKTDSWLDRLKNKYGEKALIDELK
jgi:hypothetical protein